MKDNFETIKYLNEIEVPKNIKSRSLHRMLIIKLRPFIYGFSLALIANLLFLGNSFLQHLIRSDAISVIGVVVSDFDFSLDYIINAMFGLKEVLPLMESSFLMINLIMVIYFATLFKRYHNELLKI
jgi:hypothetical protein